MSGFIGTKLTMNLGERSYDIILKNGALENLYQFARLDRRVAVVTDAGVPAEYAQRVADQCRDAKIITVPQGEASKSMKILESVLRQMLEFNMGRGDLVVAMGGGSFYNYQVAGFIPRWAVGVGVNIKLFDGLNREYKYSAARQTVRRVGELQNKAGQDVSVLVEKLYNQMMNYRNQMTSIDASLAFAEEYLRMKNAAFLEGMSSSSDLIDAELNLAAVRTERLQAAYNYDLLLAQLLEAAGVDASGISEEFAAYARRSDARPILFDKK